MASAAARLFARLQRNRGVRRAEAFALSRAARAAKMAGRRVYGFAKRNPFMSGMAAGDLLRGAQKYARKGGLKGKRKRAIAGGGAAKRAKPPTSTSARVSAQYAVAPTMRRFKSAKKAKTVKTPKTIGVHYKDYGAFEAKKCMYINHEHWGSFDRFWYGIALALTKTLLAKARIYNGKLETDAMIGPRTAFNNVNLQLDDKPNPLTLRLIFDAEKADGNKASFNNDIVIENVAASPDVYRSLKEIADDVKDVMISRYYNETGNVREYLSAAQVIVTGGTNNYHLNGTPVYVMNLDDAEVTLYTKSLIKFQNITAADHAAAGAGANPYDRSAIDANPLAGRVYSGKGTRPLIDSDLLRAGDLSLDKFFYNMDACGITLLGQPAGSAPTANDIGHIQHLPPAQQLYASHVGVTTGSIHMPAGAMKFHKTSFTMKRTFRTLASITHPSDSLDKVAHDNTFSKHTLFGFTMQHKHGNDDINIGFNREVDVSCMIKIKPKVLAIKANVSVDKGVLQTTVVPTDHAEP